MVGARSGARDEGPSTWFAPAGRAQPAVVEAQATKACSSPLVEALLRSFSGIVALVNAQRQIVATNSKLLQSLGIEDASQALGMRPGDVLQCMHSREAPDGCGTTKACASCGVAAAIVLSQADGEPVERECLVTGSPYGRPESFEFLVRGSPLRLNGEEFTVLTFTDISAEKRRNALQRVFFHDVMNTLTGLTGSCELLEGASPEECKTLAAEIQELCDCLLSQVSAQRDLQAMEAGDYRLHRTKTVLTAIVRSLEGLFRRNPVAEGRTLEWVGVTEEPIIDSDLELLLRVLTNMLTNAFEATPRGGVVKMWCDVDEETITFRVWNKKAIAPDIAAQVFKRSFSTKPGPGHGLGTYGMKLIGERYLEGRVWFTSTPEQGTCFSLRIPLMNAASDSRSSCARVADEPLAPG